MASGSEILPPLTGAFEHEIESMRLETIPTTHDLAIDYRPAITLLAPGFYLRDPAVPVN